MKARSLRALRLSALCAIIPALAASTASAATCNVPSASYPTIQSAANDATCNTINVAPGIYNENVNVPNAGTTINGSQAGNHDFATRSANAAGESIVKGAGPTVSTPIFTINAGDVTIDGFTIKNAVNLFSSSGVEVKGPGNDAAILNNIFDGITTADTSGNGTAQAVYLSSGGADNVNIQDNEMKNVHANRSTKGVLIGDNNQANPNTSVQVKGNSIHDITSDTRGGYGVLAAHAQQPVTGLTIVENNIHDITGGGWVHAIGLEGDTPGATVMSNTISNLNNTTADNVGVWFEANPSFATAQVQMNNFNLTVASFGIAVQPALTGGTVDGTCNWWNSPSGPTTATNPGGTGTKVSDGVAYNPWLIAPAPGGSCFGGNVPATSAQCRNGGWMTRTRADGSTFKNQGDCIQYTNTGK